MKLDYESKVILCKNKEFKREGEGIGPSLKLDLGSWMNSLECEMSVG